MTDIIIEAAASSAADVCESARSYHLSTLWQLALAATQRRAGAGQPMWQLAALSLHAMSAKASNGGSSVSSSASQKAMASNFNLSSWRNRLRLRR